MSSIQSLLRFTDPANLGDSKKFTRKFALLSIFSLSFQLKWESY